MTRASGVKAESQLTRPHIPLYNPVAVVVVVLLLVVVLGSIDYDLCPDIIVLLPVPLP